MTPDPRRREMTQDIFSFVNANVGLKRGHSIVVKPLNLHDLYGQGEGGIYALHMDFK